MQSNALGHSLFNVAVLWPFNMFNKAVYDFVPRGKSGFFTGLAVAFGCGATLYAIRSPIRTDTVHQTADVASQALSDHRLRQQAIVLSNEVVNKLLKNDDVVILLRDLIIRVLQQTETKNALMMLVHNVGEDPYFQETIKKLIIRTINDPWIIEKVGELSSNTARGLLQNTDLQKQLVETLKNSAIAAMESEKVQEAAALNSRAIAKRFLTVWR
ncbi:hypothetical protein XU18_0661 [Perkinsela sp. CCAP 1560/4]|nr:hypothetical protein XU18_0661 [Perkinsela sp. CCAP 1560/4]|eukprot:KNH08983.1 hypothetical protein XU18_0661 [Perkinsela sp. CCAP 1560/4]